MKTGVYQIRNLLNGKRYIGSAAGGDGFAGRWRVHRCRLVQGNSHSPKLQNAWDKYGADIFVFEVIEECKPQHCVEREQYYLDILLFAHCNDKRFDRLGYNICRVAGSQFGQKRTFEQRQRMSRAQSGCKHRNYGKQLSQSTRKAISNANLGHEVSTQTRKKIARSVAQKLDEYQVEEIRLQLESGITQNKIARKFDISQSLVSQINSGARWGWI